MGAVIGHRERLGGALRLVVDGPWPERVDITPVGFRLRVDLGIAVNLRGRGEEKQRLLGPGETEHVVGAERADLQGGNGMVGVVDGGGGRGKVQHGIDRVVHVERLADVVLDGLEGLMVTEVRDVLRRTRYQVVDADDPPAIRQQPFAEVGAEEARPTRDDSPPRGEGN